MTKCRTGKDNKEMCIDIFGGCEMRWSYGFPWMLKYLDQRYRDILGHQGLLRYLDQFPQFHRAIEREMQRPKVKYDVHGNANHYPGLAHSPFWMFGYIDCSHDQCCTPCSGPDGDFEGAPRKEEFPVMQEAFYSGYKHFHSVKVETVALPNGITTVFGPISGRGNDTTTLAHGRGAQLSWQERYCNLELGWIRQHIEFYFQEVSGYFKICASKDSYKLAKANPYVVEQLRVCHLLTNIYNCLNGDKLSSKLDVPTPVLEDYLRL
eukprot:scaffold23728_cov90-Cyclotella_meneghiniana.AAC.3